MFRRRKRVAPAEGEEYIKTRYEDTSLRILRDTRHGRALYSSYVPWLQSKLNLYYVTDEFNRQKYWVDQVPLYYNGVNISLEGLQRTGDEQVVVDHVSRTHTYYRNNATRSSTTICIIV